MPLHTDDYLLNLAMIKMLLIVIPMLLVKIALLIRATMKAQVDKIHLFFPWLLVIVISMAPAIGRLQAEIYYQDALELLQQKIETTQGEIVSNIPSPRGHGRCITTYRYAVNQTEIGPQQFTQGWNTLQCKLKPGSTVLVKYVPDYPLVSMIGDKLEPQVSAGLNSIRNTYLCLSTVVIFLLCIINLIVQRYGKLPFYLR